MLYHTPEQTLGPRYAHGKKAYETGMLGKVFTIESRLHSGNGYMHEWHLYKKYGGGMMYDWGVHLIDQILFMMPDAKVKTVLQT